MILHLSPMQQYFTTWPMRKAVYIHSVHSAKRTECKTHLLLCLTTEYYIIQAQSILSSRPSTTLPCSAQDIQPTWSLPSLCKNRPHYLAGARGHTVLKAACDINSLPILPKDMALSKMKDPCRADSKRKTGHLALRGGLRIAPSS